MADYSPYHIQNPPATPQEEIAAICWQNFQTAKLAALACPSAYADALVMAQYDALLAALADDRVLQ